MKTNIAELKSQLTEYKSMPLSRVVKQLRVELAEAKEREDVDSMRIHLFDEEVQCLRKYLAEARAENERLALENRQMLQGMKWDNQLRVEAHQEAAREAIEEMRRVYPMSGCYQVLQAYFKLEG